MIFILFNNSLNIVDSTSKQTVKKCNARGSSRRDDEYFSIVLTGTDW